MRPGAPTATSMSDIEVGRAPPTRRTSGSGAPTELVLNGAPDPRGNGSVVGIGAFPDPLEDLGGEPHGDRCRESPRPPPRGPLRHLVGGLGEEVVLLLRSRGVNTHVDPFCRQRSCRSRRPRRVPSRGSRGCGPGPGAPPPEPRLRGVGLPAGRRVTDAVPESRPRGSRFGDVTWARMARGGVDSVELTWHYASRTRPAPAPAAPGLVREPARGRRGPDPDPRPIPSRPGRPRARHLTRENVPLADVLAGYPTISRVG